MKNGRLVVWGPLILVLLLLWAGYKFLSHRAHHQPVMPAKTASPQRVSTSVTPKAE